MINLNVVETKNLKNPRFGTGLPYSIESGETHLYSCKSLEIAKNLADHLLMTHIECQAVKTK